ncbi:hypothetical protein BHE74_00018352 [Ensete ventricosum]|nr:hypothetical protein GW17_00004189 [Ensete ventricosum]RWW73727.1 hypothetical protein BHE74_00018352 [Ensete ventricosum]
MNASHAADSLPAPPQALQASLFVKELKDRGMGCRTSCVLVMALLVSVVVASNVGGVDAARAVPDCFDDGGESYLAYPSTQEKARATVATWMARLPSGPSPKGPGH